MKPTERMSEFETLASEVWRRIRGTEPLGEIPDWPEVDEAQRQAVLTGVGRLLLRVGDGEIVLTVIDHESTIKTV